MNTSTILRSVETITLVAIGGFAGSNLRYFAGIVLPGLQGTILVNTLGSFVLGFLFYEAIHFEIVADEAKVVAATGFLSSFTTYSTFVVETVQQTPTWAVANVIASYVLGFAGVLAARTLVRRLDGGPA